jgi:hypothetical protein
MCADASRAYRSGGPPAIDQPQLNLDDPPPHDEGEEDSEVFEEEKAERILLGLSAPQAAHFKGPSSSLAV